MIHLKNKEDIEILKKSGKILSELLNTLSDNIKVGAKLKSLEEIASRFVKERDVIASFYGYQPESAYEAFPAHICVSVNDVVVHGVPDNRVIKNGDVIKIDAGITYNGMVTDAARTFIAGKGSTEAKKLLEATRGALNDAIKVAKPGKTLGDIGNTIEKKAKKYGFFVLKELTGHGVGYELHEDPIIFNFGNKGEGMKLKEGMVIAIEPMFSTTSENIIQNPDDSYSTDGGGITAHFEDSIAITKKGNIILTR